MHWKHSVALEQEQVLVNQIGLVYITRIHLLRFYQLKSASVSTEST